MPQTLRNMLKRQSTVVFALILIASRGHAQELHYIFVESPTLHPTFVQVPDNFDRGRTYSAVVALHGYGASPETFLDATRDIARAGYILASVSAPYQFRIDDSLVGYDWSYRHLGQAALSQRASQLSVDYIVAAIAALRTSYQIDKVYLMGFSQGGTFAYLTTSAHPHAVDGLIALGSRFDAAWFEGGATGEFPVFIGHGQRENERSVRRCTCGARLSPGRRAQCDTSDVRRGACGAAGDGGGDCEVAAGEVVGRVGRAGDGGRGRAISTRYVRTTDTR